MGVSGILSVAPYYNKPTQEGCTNIFRFIAGAVSVPILLYNVPGRTGVNIEPVTVKAPLGHRYDRGHQGSVREHFSNGFHRRPGARAFRGSLRRRRHNVATLPLGGRGVISVASNEIPAEMAGLCNFALQNNFTAARAIHSRYLR